MQSTQGLHSRLATVTFGNSWASPQVQHLVHVLACFADHIHRVAHRLTLHEFLDNDGSQDEPPIVGSEIPCSSCADLRVSRTIYIQYKYMRRLLINMWIEDNHGEELSKILSKDGDRYKLSRSSQNCQ